MNLFCCGLLCVVEVVFFPSLFCLYLNMLWCFVALSKSFTFLLIGVPHFWLTLQLYTNSYCKMNWFICIDLVSHSDGVSFARIACVCVCLYFIYFFFLILSRIFPISILSVWFFLFSKFVLFSECDLCKYGFPLCIFCFFLLLFNIVIVWVNILFLRSHS